MKNIVILISGRGSNMEAMLAAKLPCRISAVISNKADAKGLETARAHGIPTAVVAHAEHASRELFDAALAAEIDRHAPDLVVLAGFMRILGEDFVRRYHGRLMNIHPSLLPAWRFRPSSHSTCGSGSNGPDPIHVWEPAPIYGRATYPNPGSHPVWRHHRSSSSIRRRGCCGCSRWWSRRPGR